MGALDRPNDARRRIKLHLGHINRDAILTELLELEGMLQDDRLNDHDRLALAASAAQRICNPAFGSEIVHDPERCQGSLMNRWGTLACCGHSKHKRDLKGKRQT
jgi:hypothetical protein